MQSTAEKIYQPVFARKPETIKSLKAKPEDICFNAINAMIKERIERDAVLLMSVCDSNAHI